MNNYQSKKGEKSNYRVSMSLEKYEEIMKSFPYMVRPKQKTLWIPFDSSNRSITISLDHEVKGFDKDGYLIGVNGNCETAYAIVCVPNFLDETHIEKMIKDFSKEQGKEFNRRNLNMNNVSYILNWIKNEVK